MKSAFVLCCAIMAAVTMIFVGDFALAGGTTVGNGGDYVRSVFLKMGGAVITYLNGTESGRSLVKKHGLNLKELDATLSIDRVSVSFKALTDNRGSNVDAIGVPGKITLYKDSWERFFSENLDVYSLVFHEILRSAGVDDDSYIISQALKPFPDEFKIAPEVVTGGNHGAKLRAGVYWAIGDSRLCDAIVQPSPDGRTIFTRVPGSRHGTKGAGGCPERLNFVALTWTGFYFENDSVDFHNYVSVVNDHCFTSISPLGSNTFCKAP